MTLMNHQSQLNYILLRLLYNLQYTYIQHLTYNFVLKNMSNNIIVSIGKYLFKISFLVICSIFEHLFLSNTLPLIVPPTVADVWVK